MFSLSNGISLLRAPLAFFFLFENVSFRISAIIMAMISDTLDGYIARRKGETTQLGAILDPAMDKFFVYFALGIFLYEDRLQVWQACAMIARDFFLCIFAIYLTFSKKWEGYEFKSIRWGKVTTALQFFVLIGLSLNVQFSWVVYSFFILFGVMAFFELCQIKKSSSF